MGIFGGAKDSPKELKVPSDQTKEEQDTVSFVKEKLEKSRSTANRVAHEGIWLTNIAYLLGYDGLYFDTGTRQFRSFDYTGAFLRRQRIHMNKILPTVQNRLARLAQNEPRYDVVPRSMEQDDKDAATLSIQVLIDIWQREQVNIKRLHVIQGAQQAGHGYFLGRWDTSKGEKAYKPPEEQEVPGNEGLLEGVDSPQATETNTPDDGTTTTLGDVSVEYVSAFEVYPDPNAQSFSECNHVIRAKVRPLSYFKDQYERGFMVKEEGVWLMGLQYENRINGFTNYGATIGGAGDIKNSAIEITYYEKPNKQNPQGRHIIIANNVLLKDDVLPIDEIPMTKLDDIMISGKYYSEAVITQLRPLQDQYNRGLAMRAAWTNQLLAGKYIAARGHGLINEAFTDKSGEIVEYDPVPDAPPPQAMQVPMLPQWAYEEDANLEKKMDTFSGINEVSQGRLPTGGAGIPAIGMQFLVEQDSTRLSVETKQHEQCYADLGRIILKFVEKYYEAERTVAIVGKGKEYLVKKFSGKDLKGHTNVKVVPGSTLPGSKVLDRQEILNLYDRGLLGMPQDPKVAAETLEKLQYGDIDGVWNEQSLDMAQISRHIEMIEKDIAPPVHEGDNHTLFYRELNNYRKSEKYDKLGDSEKMKLLTCMEQHLNEQTNIVAPNSGDDPNNPDLQPTQQAQNAAQEQGINPQDAIQAANSVPPPPQI